MKRNVRFWTRFTWENVEMELVAVGIFLVIGAVNSDSVWAGGSSGWMNYLALAPFYLIIAAAICMIIVAPGCQMLYIPLLISHGEPRKNVFWGFQYHRLLLITVTSAVSALVWALVPGQLSEACLSCLPVIITVLVISSSCGNLLGAAFVKWRWCGVVIMALSSGVVGGLVGWLGTAGGFDISAMSLFTRGLTALGLPWQMAVAAVALLAADMGIQWLLLRRREVKL